MTTLPNFNDFLNIPSEYFVKRIRENYEDDEDFKYQIQSTKENELIDKVELYNSVVDYFNSYANQVLIDNNNYEFEFDDKLDAHIDKCLKISAILHEEFEVILNKDMEFIENIKSLVRNVLAEVALDYPNDMQDIINDGFYVTLCYQTNNKTFYIIDDFEQERLNKIEKNYGFYLVRIPVFSEDGQAKYNRQFDKCFDVIKNMCEGYDIDLSDYNYLTKEELGFLDKDLESIITMYFKNFDELICTDPEEDEDYANFHTLRKQLLQKDLKNHKKFEIIFMDLPNTFPSTSIGGSSYLDMFCFYMYSHFSDENKTKIYFANKICNYLEEIKIH